jgi:hypothetical protein
MDKTSRRMDGKGGFFMRLPNKLGSPKALRNAKRLRVRGRTFWWSAKPNRWVKPYHAPVAHWGTIYRELPDGSLEAWKYVGGDRRPITRIIEEALAAPSKTKGVLP